MYQTSKISLIITSLSKKFDKSMTIDTSENLIR